MTIYDDPKYVGSYCIYGIYEQPNNDLKYIGATVNVKRRFMEHYNRSQTKQGEQLRQWCETHKYDLQIIESFEECTIEYLYEREKYWIRYYSDKGIELINVPFNSNKTQTFYCEQNGKKYYNHKEAATDLNINQGQIWGYFKGLYKGVQGYTFTYNKPMQLKNRYDTHKYIYCEQNGKMYSSYIQASIDLNISRHKFTKFFRGITTHIDGYTFTYNKPTILKPKVDVFMFYCEQTGEGYHSYKEAGKDLNMNPENIKHNLQLNKLNTRGYTFSYSKCNTIKDKQYKDGTCSKFILPIYCEQTGEVFNSIEEISKHFNVSVDIIKQHITGNIKGRNVSFRYTFSYSKPIRLKHKRGTIYCFETDTIYDTYKEAAIDLNIVPTRVHKILRTKHSKRKKYNLIYLIYKDEI